jgi:hypothetical protein
VTIDRRVGLRLTGTWIARIPVDRYESFLEELSTLGVTENFNQTAQDVTEEFVDLEARIANKRQLEKRILQLLEESEGKVEEILEVERELARVRSEVEQMDGRLRYLTNRTDLTTITIRAVELKDYVPPKAPTFTSRIVRAWSGSIEALAQFGQNLIIAIVFMAPWAVLLMLLLAPVIWILRRTRMRRSSRSPQSNPFRE